MNFMYIQRAMVHARGMTSTRRSSRTARRSSSPTPAQGTQAFYDGNSQGGIMGGPLTALSPDITPQRARRARHELLDAAQPQRRLGGLLRRGRSTPRTRTRSSGSWCFDADPDAVGPRRGQRLRRAPDRPTRCPARRRTRCCSSRPGATTRSRNVSAEVMARTAGAPVMAGLCRPGAALGRTQAAAVRDVPAPRLRARLLGQRQRRRRPTATCRRASPATRTATRATSRRPAGRRHSSCSPATSSTSATVGPTRPTTTPTTAGRSPAWSPPPRLGPQFRAVG